MPAAPKMHPRTGLKSPRGNVPDQARACSSRRLVGGGQAAGGTAAGIAAGAAADLVSLDAGHVALAGCAGDAVLDAWVFAEERLVECVWVAGVRVVEGGRHRAAAGIGGRYRGVVRRLMG